MNMLGEKYIYKEDYSTKKKAVKFLIFFGGELVISILLLITIQLFKTEEVGLAKFITISTGVFFSIILGFVALLTWGFFHSHEEIRITKTGIKKSFRLPPFIFSKIWIEGSNIISVSFANGKKKIYPH